MSFSGQMMGCLLVDREGIPLRPMITWADTRASKQEKEIIDRIELVPGHLLSGGEKNRRGNG